MNGFIDIHCHILPGIDDGATDLETARSMARQAVDAGTNTIVATPHMSAEWPKNSVENIRQHISQLQRHLAEHQIDLRILPGADIRVDEDFVTRAKSGELLSLADTGRYLLIELPHEVAFPLDELLFTVGLAGYRCVLSHPERNLAIQSNPQQLTPLIAQGCVIQITAGSIIGVFGSRAQCVARQLLEQRMAHVVASDAHSLRRRNPSLNDAYHHVANRHGQPAAETLFEINPGRIVAGKELDLPVPLKKRSWWQFGRAA